MCAVRRARADSLGGTIASPTTTSRSMPWTISTAPVDPFADRQLAGSSQDQGEDGDGDEGGEQADADDGRGQVAVEVGTGGEHAGGHHRGHRRLEDRRPPGGAVPADRKSTPLNSSN